MDTKYREVRGGDREYEYTEIFRKLSDNKLYAVKRLECECVFLVEVEPI